MNIPINTIFFFVFLHTIENLLFPNRHLTMRIVDFFITQKSYDDSILIH